jgi:flagellar hook assembly protein FlgD
MNLVYSGKSSIVTNDYITVKWDGRNNNGNKVASGVYVYVTKANGKIKKGKFVIFN